MARQNGYTRNKITSTFIRPCPDYSTKTKSGVRQSPRRDATPMAASVASKPSNHPPISQAANPNSKNAPAIGFLKPGDCQKTPIIIPENIDIQ
jgi:hypothetical protein